jgi:hypothetical protein
VTPTYRHELADAIRSVLPPGFFLGWQSPIDQGVFKGSEVGVGVAAEAAAERACGSAALQRGPQGTPGGEVRGGG